MYNTSSVFFYESVKAYDLKMFVGFNLPQL